MYHYKNEKYRYKLSKKLYDMTGGATSIQNKIVYYLKKILYILIHINIKNIFAEITSDELKTVMETLELLNKNIKIQLKTNITKEAFVKYMAFSEINVSYIPEIITLLRTLNLISKDSINIIFVDIMILTTYFLNVSRKIPIAGTVPSQETQKLFSKLGNLFNNIDKNTSYNTNEQSISINIPTKQSTHTNTKHNYYIASKLMANIKKIFATRFTNSTTNTTHNLDVNDIIEQINTISGNFEEIKETNGQFILNDDNLGHYLNILEWLYYNIKHIIHILFEYLVTNSIATTNLENTDEVLDFTIHLIKLLHLYYKKETLQANTLTDRVQKIDYISGYLFDLIFELTSQNNETIDVLI